MNPKLKVLLPILIVFSPYKSLSLGFMVIYFTYEFFHIRFEKMSSLIVLAIIFLNLTTSVFINGPSFLANNILFWIFILPIIIFIIRKPDSHNNTYSYINNIFLKKSLEIFLIIQIIFSFLAMIYRLSIGFNFDVNFGDIIAGTLRSPFAFSVDASNVIFTFSMILLLFIYITLYKKKINNYILFLSIFIIFAASVNHLILAAGLAMTVSTFKNKPFKVIILFGTILLLYTIFQEKNLNLITERVENLTLAITDMSLLFNLSTKGAYFVNMFHDIENNFLNFLFTGFGAGTYSSRASLFFTGEYVKAFPIVNMSEYFTNNTYVLWKQLLAAPNWLSGAFYFPYSGLGSLLMELGLMNFLILGYLFLSKLKKLNILNFAQRLFLIIFILIANLIDNYFEYYQSFFLAYYFLFNFHNQKTLKELRK